MVLHSVISVFCYVAMVQAIFSEQDLVIVVEFVHSAIRSSSMKRSFSLNAGGGLNSVAGWCPEHDRSFTPSL